MNQPYPTAYEQALGLTDKQIRKLRRVDLLELLVEQGRELERLRGELALAQAQLEDRRIMLESCGSIAEASLKINGVFEAAQAAANQYLEAVKEACPQTANSQTARPRASQPQMVHPLSPQPQAVRPLSPQSHPTRPQGQHPGSTTGADAQATGRLSVLPSAGSPATPPAASPATPPAATPAPAARVAGNHFAAAKAPASAATSSPRGRHMAGA